MGIAGGDEAEAVILREVGRRVRAARRTAGLTQDELAGHLGLGRSSVSNMEAGRQVITAVHLTVLAEVLGVPASDLLGVPGADGTDLKPHKVTVSLSCKVSCTACGTSGLEVERSDEEPDGSRHAH